MATKKTPQSKKPPVKPDDETDDPQETEETDETEETEDDAAEENRRINAIVTSRVKREMKPLNTALAQISAQLAEMQKATKQTETTDDDEQETKSQEPDPKLTKKMTKLEKELADEKAARVKAETERAQEQEKAKRNEMRSIYATHLTELGLTSPRLQRAALDQLEQDGIMIRDEEGKVKFKGQDKYGIEQNFEPKVGLKSWIAGEGKEFVPAVDAGGSGTGGTRGTGNGTQHLTASDLKKMSPQQLASINLERACSGMPPLGQPE